MEERLGDTMMKGVNTVLGWWQLNVDAAESEEAGPPELTCHRVHLGTIKMASGRSHSILPIISGRSAHGGLIHTTSLRQFSALPSKANASG